MSLQSRSAGARAYAALLLGTASLLALGTAAWAQGETPGADVEEVLVTGSLIHGAQAVGVPVTSLAPQDFKESGAITIADMFKNIPAVVMPPTNSGASGTSSFERGQVIRIHNLDGSVGVRDLLMVDGVRVPSQGHTGKGVDPSVIPTLAVDRIDVLADGASATYGSDAISGVVNVIMKRGFDGAELQVRGGYMQGGAEYQAAGLWGRKWDGGDITVSYEWYDESAVPATQRPGYTMDYRPWGLDDQTPIQSSIPAVISTAKPTSAVYGTACTNCYSVPSGQNGIGLTWATLLLHPGANNEVNPYQYADAIVSLARNSATITFDQRLLPGVSVFGDAFYMNRRAHVRTGTQLASKVLVTYAVPTNNPYYPIGAPAGLMVSYSPALELHPYNSSYEVTGRYNFGFNVDLPYSWHGKIYNSLSQDNSNTDYMNQGQSAAVSAALGNTVKPGGQFANFIKPANIPYLNVFCDPRAFTCNDPATLRYIQGWRHQDTISFITEKGVNFDGPLFDLPGGTVRAAVGALYDHYVINYIDNANLSTLTPDGAYTFSPNSRNVWAVFTQVNIPIFSDANAIPLFRKLDLEGSWRHDQYNDVGGTSNPKVAFNWTPVDGLTFRGSWGTAFRAPAFTESAATGPNITLNPINVLAGETSNSTGVSCVGGKPVAGSAAALVNPTCNPALLFPGGIATQGSAGFFSAVLRNGQLISPEKSANYGIGVDIQPTEYLKGLDLSVTYYKVHISGVLQSFLLSASTFNDPNYAFTFITPGQVGAAKFAEMVNALVTNYRSNVSPSAATSISFIQDGGVQNAGYLKQDGIDFNARYDWDMADSGLGSWDAGIVGTYNLHSVTFSGVPGTVPVDAFHTSTGSGLALSQGVEQSPRLVYRARLGWSDGGFSITGFVNYRSHYFHAENPPPASYFVTFPNYTNIEPSYYTFDLSAGYTLGDTPASEYLKNVSFQLVFLDILDKHPPFEYAISHNTYNNQQAFDPTLSDVGRVIQLSITKDW